MNHIIKLVLLLALVTCGQAFARDVQGGPQQTPSSVAQQNQQSQSSAASLANQVFNASPANTHATIDNVASPILGGYAPAMSSFGCAPTTQGGAGFAGFVASFGGAVDKFSCVMFTAAAETVRQTTVMDPADPMRPKLLQAATNMRCVVNTEIYDALTAAGVKCDSKPENVIKRERNAATPNVSYAGN